MAHANRLKRGYQSAAGDIIGTAVRQMVKDGFKEEDLGNTFGGESFGKM